MKKAIILLLSLSSLCAAPKIKQVRHGKVKHETNGNTTTYQTGKKAIIDFHKFDIHKGETVRFIQQGKNGRVLGRIEGPASQIDGALKANGKVYLVNPAGFVFGPTATIQAHHFYAAAGSMSDKDFLSGINRFSNVKGPIQFEGKLKAEAAHFFGKKVIIDGELKTPEGCLVVAAGESMYCSRNGGHVFLKVAPTEGGGIGAEDVYAAALGTGSTIQAKEVVVRGDKVDMNGAVEAKSGRIAVDGGKVVCGNNLKMNADGGTIGLYAEDHLHKAGQIDGKNIHTFAGGDVTKDYYAKSVGDVNEQSFSPVTRAALVCPNGTANVDLSTQSNWDDCGFEVATGSVAVTAVGAGAVMTFGNDGGAGGLTDANFTAADDVTITAPADGVITINGCRVRTSNTAPITVDTGTINIQGNSLVGTLNAGGKLTIDATSTKVLGSRVVTLGGVGIEIPNSIFGGAERETPLVLAAKGGDVAIGASYTVNDFTIGTGESLKSVTVLNVKDFTVTGSVRANGFTIINGTGDINFLTNFITPTAANAGLFTTGNIDTEFPLSSTVDPGPGGNVNISTTGDINFESPFYYIDASGGSAVSLGQGAQPGGDVTLTSTSGNININRIMTQAGMPIAPPGTQSSVVGGDITITAQNGTVTAQGKLLSTRLPIQQGSGSFGSGGAITIDSPMLILSKGTVNVDTSIDFPAILSSTTNGVVQNFTVTGNTISLPEMIVESSAATGLLPIYSFVSESVGASSVSGTYGTASRPAGNILVSYADDYTMDMPAFVTTFVQQQGIGRTQLTFPLVSDGIVRITNQGTISVNGVTTDNANITLQPAVTFTNTAQGNIPDGFLEILGDMSAGTGDIFLSNTPRGANISVATIYNNGSNPITLEAKRLITGPNEVFTSFDDMTFNCSELVRTGDLVSIDNISLNAPSIQFVIHPEYNILTNVGDFVVNPEGAHIVAGGNVTTSSAPQLVNPGVGASMVAELIIQEGILISQTLLTFNTTVLNFLGNAIPPPPPPPGPPTPANLVSSNIGLIFYGPLSYLDLSRIDLIGEVHEINQEIEKICKQQKQDLAACEIALEWDRVKRHIVENKYALDRLTERYMQTHSGRFHVEDFLHELGRSDKGREVSEFLRLLAHFELDIQNNYPEHAAHINDNLNAYVKPEEMSDQDWQKILDYFSIKS